MEKPFAVVKLKCGVKYELREPVARDVFGLNFKSEDVHKNYCELIARISPLTIQQVEELPLAEYLSLITRVAKFFGDNK